MDYEKDQIPKRRKRRNNTKKPYPIVIEMRYIGPARPYVLSKYEGWRRHRRYKTIKHAEEGLIGLRKSWPAERYEFRIAR